MKKIGQISYFIISLSLLTGIFIIILYYFVNKHTNELTSSKNSYIISNNTLLTSLIDANNNLGHKINNLSLIDTLSVKSKLKNIINSKNILIYRVAYSHCSSCDISGLKSLTKKISAIPYDDIIILGSFYNNNDLKIFIKSNQIKFKIFNLKQSLNLPAEEFDMPYFIVVSKDLTVMSCFFPEKAAPEYTDYFFSGIKHFFQNNK